ncbi:MAG: hypothetical protein LBU23_01665, partial [Planctomycetota bacterium]|nr:hypothetical protein [Planctomycetota bacterium]
MSGSIPRMGMLVLSALLPLALAAGAGELSRPVPPDAQVTRFTRFNLRYSLRDAEPGSIARIEFFITEDMGRTWRFYADDADRIPPMTIEVPGEGVYGFVSVATDRFGNREREPVARSRPETVIVVDRTPPQAKWLSPLQNVLSRGRGAELAWESGDPYFGPTPVKLQYAVDARSNHDRDAVWTNIQEGLPAAGKQAWTPPGDVSGRYNFRLVAEDRAGNLAVAYCPATVTIDNSPPGIVSVGPLRSNKLEAPIIVEADDGQGGSGVKEISLYASDNSGNSWTLVKEPAADGATRPAKRKSGEPILFTAARAGDYPLWPVAFDEAGNATPLPSAGIPGSYVLTIDNEPPTVSLQNSFLMGRSVVLANESRIVSWTAYDPHILANSASILLSLDNGATWQTLRAGLPANGTETVYFPFGSHSEEAKLKVTVADEFGNIGEGVSEVFRLSGAETVIDSVTPAHVPSPSLAEGFEDIFGGDAGQPPYIPLAPAGPGGPGYPAPPAPSAPSAPLAPIFPATPQPPAFPAPPNAPIQGSPPADPYAQPAAPYPPASPDPYQYPLSLESGPGGESTAASVPKAMLGLPLGGQPPAPPAEASRPPPDQSRWDWIPTPPDSGQAAIPPPGPTAPTPAGPEVALLPPASDSLQPPPAPGTPPRSPQTSLFGDDWLTPTTPIAPMPAGGDSPPTNFGGGSLFDSLSPPGGNNQQDSAFNT